MDFSDFLVEYDLTPQQRLLAARLKAEANLKQLLNSLADHALFYSQELVASTRVRNVPGSRASVLAWFSALTVPQRVAALTCQDASWIRALMQMSRLRGPGASPEGRFSVLSKPGPGGREAPRAGRAGRALAPAAAAAGTAKQPGREPVLHYRRPHRLPDGELLVPPAPPGYRSASDALVAGLRLAFKVPLAARSSLEWDAVVISPTLVADVTSFTSLMDKVTLGKFLCHTPAEPPRPTATSPWPEAAWLRQWGSHFPLAAFCASRLEVLLVHGYATRDASALPQPLSLPLAEVWSTMPAAARGEQLRSLCRRLLARLLTESLAAARGGGGAAGAAAAAGSSASAAAAWTPLRALAALVDKDGGQERAGAPGPGALASAPPLELTAASLTAPLQRASAPPCQVAPEELLLNHPDLWLHHQFAEELAIVCSEHSASSLLDASREAEEALARGTRRSNKRQRQKLRRRQAEETAATMKAVEEEEHELPRQPEEPVPVCDGQPRVSCLKTELVQEPVCDGQPLVSCLKTELVQEPVCDGQPLVSCLKTELVQEPIYQPPKEEPCCCPENEQEAPSLSFTASVASVLQETTPAGFLEEWDGHTSELSSTGLRTSRSNSVAEGGIGLQTARANLTQWSLLERSYWDAELRRSRLRQSQAAAGRWHDDSRLEFLLRNRDRFATEFEWDRLSQGSVPASLDEAALYPVGLEARFAYLFDSPTRSHVTTSLASQATAEDDAERLRMQWEENLDEWQSLTQALEKAETEREIWKAKALELEHLVTGQPVVRQVSGVSADDGVPSGYSSETAAGVICGKRSLKARRSGEMAPGDRTPDRGGGGGGDDAVGAWRYLSLLLLARRQVDLQLGSQRPVLLPQQSDERIVVRSISMPRLGRTQAEEPAADPAEEEALAAAAAKAVLLASEEAGQSQGEEAMMHESDASSPRPAPETEVRKRALHVTFETRCKRNTCENATQTAPAITLSKMYGGMVPRYIQRELARLRSENQLLRIRVNHMAMSQTIRGPKPVRHQATQTAPAITFSPARQQGGHLAEASTAAGSRGPRHSTLVTTPAPAAAQMLRLQQVNPTIDPTLSSYPLVSEQSWLMPECRQSILDESIHAFLGAVEAQTRSQDAYRCAIQGLCQRAAQTLWPRSSVELYGSFSSGLALPSSGLDLVIYPNRHSLHHAPELDPKQRHLSPIEEDAGQRRQLPLDEVSPGHSASKPTLSSGWLQQLSCRLVQEKWVFSDSIRITAHAAIPVLSFVTAPKKATPLLAEAEEPASCPIRVEITLEDLHHRGLRSKAYIAWLLDEYQYARPVTLVMKQWLNERTYCTSHTGGLCSYGLLLMVVGFLQHYQAGSVAAALVGFINFYGRRFDPQLYGVSVARGAFLRRKDPISWPPPEAKYLECGFCPGSAEFGSLSRRLVLTGEDVHRFDPLWVEDPLNPTNNVGRNCFRIRQIQRSLAVAADSLAASEASATLRSILRVDGHAELQGGEDGIHWREGEAMDMNLALHHDLYQSLVESAPELLLTPVHAQIARSHLPQQWDSAVRYAARPHASRSRC